MSNVESSKKAKIKAFFKEFPFIERYFSVKDEPLAIPVVRRLDLDLLDAWGYIYEYEKHQFWLIDADGNELTAIQPHMEIRDKKFNLFRPSTWHGRSIHPDTVLEGIRKMDDPDRIKFVLEINYYPLTKITVHKVPARIKFSDWLNKIQDIAGEQLQGDIAEIDNV